MGRQNNFALLGQLIAGSTKAGLIAWDLGAVILAVVLARFNYQAAVEALNSVG